MASGALGTAEATRAPPRARTLARAYAAAVAVTALVVALKYLFSSSLGRDAPFLFMLASTVAVTWYAGRGPGLLGCVLGTAAVNYFFLPPYDDWHSTPAADAQTALFGAESLLVWWLTSTTRSARDRALAATRRIERVYATSSAIAQSRSLEEVAQRIVRESAAALGASAIGLFVVADDRASLRLLADVHYDPALAAGLKVVPLERPLPMCDCARTGRVIAVGRADELRRRYPELCAMPRSRPLLPSLLSVPVRDDGDRTLAVICMAFERERRFAEADRAFVQQLGRDFARALERARFVEAERRLRLEAEAASRTKDDLLCTLSHELRTPLAAISGWVQLLKRGGAADEARRAHAFDVIERSVHAEARLVEDLLDMSRIVTDRMRVEMQPVDLAPLVIACLEEAEPFAAARGLEVAWSAAPGVRVSGDADRLQQVVRSLLSNAMKFTPRGGHVWIELRTEAAWAVLRVRDDGQGVPPEHMARVFETFRQVDASSTRREGGLGLGLAIVRHLVEAHGGAVRLESPGPGKGTTATVELPLLVDRA